MCPACADKVLLWHFRAWAESDPWSHLSSGAKVSHNTSLWLFVLWRACRLLFPVSHAEEGGTSIYNTPDRGQHNAQGEHFLMQMNGANCASHLSNRDNPSQGTTFSCASTGRRQLWATVTPLSWNVCKRMCTYTREVQLQKNYFIKLSILLPLIGAFSFKFTELNTEW